ncbi:hypothetical protein L6452_03392 [Arctium lappa]|uniref:Uncharacterized protein n=1 Tax=Arctium lappa TaxID=4217 RepID=A0ACB9FNA5_ARCLA|nr:hypothetical protein L6452_03392 [Arctium lappa]
MDHGWKVVVVRSVDGAKKRGRYFTGNGLSTVTGNENWEEADDEMKTIWEKGEDDGSSGGCRTMMPETNTRVGGGENGSMLEIDGGTKSMRIIQQEECNSSSSSSIGDDSDEDRDGDAESRYRYEHQNNNGSFDDAIQALEEALPIRKGISTFYNGKSKSFTSLADVWPSTTSSIQDIAKPENAYTRKRRNLGAFKLSNINTGRISKKPKTTTLHFTSDREKPNFIQHAKQSQIKRPLQLRSFSMVNLHRYNSAKIANCWPELRS